MDSIGRCFNRPAILTVDALLMMLAENAFWCTTFFMAKLNVI